jgi:hypothetical protein
MFHVEGSRSNREKCADTSCRYGNEDAISRWTVIAPPLRESERSLDERAAESPDVSVPQDSGHTPKRLNPEYLIMESRTFARAIPRAAPEHTLRPGTLLGSAIAFPMMELNEAKCASSA